MRISKNFYFSLFLITLALCNIIFPINAKEICAGFKGDINFSVKVIPKNIHYNLGISQEDLHQLAGKKYGQNKKKQILGLTSTKQSISTKMAGQVSKMSTGLFCFQVTSVDIKIKILQLDVFVLGKYARGSCQYAAIIDHEHEHVTTYQIGINKLERAFNRKLLGIIKRLPPSISNTPEKARNIAFKMVLDKIKQIKTPISRAMKYRDQQIDTPLSYKSLTQQCSSW